MRDSHSEVGEIRRMVLCHPRDAFVDEARVRAQWQALNYLDAPDFAGALAEYDGLIEIFSDCGIELSFLPGGDGAGLDSIYVHDAATTSPKGVILCNMGKAQRQAEPAALGAHLDNIGVPVLGAIAGQGRLEGGDVVWFDEGTVAVGRGYRTNDAGIRQFRTLLGDGVEVVVVPLPHWKGADDVFHLMSILSPIDHDLALVYAPLLPVPFREWLLGRGIKLIEVPEAEFESMGCNVLALAPRRCLALAGNPLTRRKLEAEKVQVREFSGREISLKGGGGPTCLTRPLVRG